MKRFYLTIILSIFVWCLALQTSAPAQEPAPDRELLSAPAPGNTSSFGVTISRQDEDNAASETDIDSSVTESNPQDMIEGQITIDNPSVSVQKPEDILATMPEEVQNELMEDAAEAHNYCERNYLLRNFYDCECWALEFLHDRIRKGPDVPFTNIVIDSKYDNCVSTPKIAGYGYQRCHDIVYLDRITDEGIENVCGCSGRTLASDYKKRPAPHIKYINNLFRETLKDCRREYRMR